MHNETSVEANACADLSKLFHTLLTDLSSLLTMQRQRCGSEVGMQGTGT